MSQTSRRLCSNKSRASAEAHFSDTAPFLALSLVTRSNRHESDFWVSINHNNPLAYDNPGDKAVQDSVGRFVFTADESVIIDAGSHRVSRSRHIKQEKRIGIQPNESIGIRSSHDQPIVINRMNIEVGVARRIDWISDCPIRIPQKHVAVTLADNFTKIIDAGGNAAGLTYNVDWDKFPSKVEKWTKPTGPAYRIAAYKIAIVVNTEDRGVARPGSIVGRKAAGGKEKAVRMLSSEINATDDPFIIDPKGLGAIGVRWHKRRRERSIGSAGESFRPRVA